MSYVKKFSNNNLNYTIRSDLEMCVISNMPVSCGEISNLGTDVTKVVELLLWWPVGVTPPNEFYMLGFVLFSV